MHRHLLALLLLVLTVGPLSATAQRDASMIRVRLLEREVPERLVVSAPERGLRLYAGDLTNPIVELSSDEQVTLSVRGMDVQVETDEQTFFTLSLRILPIRDGLLDLDAADAVGQAMQRRYAGHLRVLPDGTALKVINHVPLEDYVASVVSHEYGFEDLEGNKAMAVLARTYALRAAGRAAAYDVSDHTGSQVYRGHTDLVPAAVEATRATVGEVLTYEGDLVEAVYFASSGGLTASNEDVWQSDPVPYLRSRPDPFDADAPYQRWEAKIPRTRFLSILSDTYDAPVTGFLLHEIGDDERVRTVRLLGAEQIITGVEFRALVNQYFGATRLRSTLFDARREGDTYVFEGSGYGHGVGLSQWGAHEMAEQGYAYTEILAQYYAGVMLRRAGRAIALPPPPPAVAKTATRPPDPPRERKVDKPTRTSTKRRIGW